MKLIYLFVASPIEVDVGSGWLEDFRTDKKFLTRLYHRDVSVEDVGEMSRISDEIDHLRKSHPYSIIKSIIL